MLVVESLEERVVELVTIGKLLLYGFLEMLSSLSYHRVGSSMVHSPYCLLRDRLAFPDVNIKLCHSGGLLPKQK